MSETIVLNLTRQINFKKNGKKFSGVLRLDRVEHVSARKWVCFWSCDYLCDQGHVFGEDPLHALVNCLALVRSLIAGAANEGLTIWWQSPGDNCWM
jgi:hypothetical protein